MQKTDKHKLIPEYSAVILAGGNSSRMSFPKPWLKCYDGKFFLQKLIDTIKLCGINNSIVILNKSFTENEWKENCKNIKNQANIVLNPNPNKGRLHSLYLGLKESNTNHNLILNVDSPFINPNTIKKLAENCNDNDVVIPTYNTKSGHPIIINELVKNEILKNYTQYFSLKEVLGSFKKNYIEVNDKNILNNINTPDDFKALKHEYV